MKMILLCAALLILGMQAGCTKTCTEKHWFDGRAFSECVRIGGGCEVYFFRCTFDANTASWMHKELFRKTLV